jgi:uncharacterized membrane protein YdjX (TVP38/TMEM64 family)
MTEEEKNIQTSKLPLIVSISTLAILAGCYWLIPSFHEWINNAFEILTSGDQKRIRRWVGQFGAMGPVILILVMVVQMFLFVIPNVLVMIVAIASYGPIWGSLIALTGVFASSSLGYFIGKYVSPAVVRKFLSIKMQKRITDFIQHYGIAAIAITRLSSLSNDSLSFVAGILKMKYKHYILATLSGITPLIVLLAIYGNNGKIEKALILIAAISVVLLIIYILLDKRRRKKK